MVRFVDDEKIWKVEDWVELGLKRYTIKNLPSAVYHLSPENSMKWCYLNIN